jgi:predicted ATPase/DNA-binding winged helix-turn-helix (wHTH) protein/tetratricopeptide (TPR) repeat protein
VLSLTDQEPPSQIRLEIGVADIERQRLSTAKGERSLSPTETALLAYMASRPGEILDQETLLQDVWGYAPTVQSRTVYTTINRLRSKIECDPQRPQHLLTVPNRGYEFRPLPGSDGVNSAPESYNQAQSEAVPPTNLRAEFDSFVGRSELLEEISSRFSAGARLVTLLGPGGVGKTRLSRSFGGGQRSSYPGGVWFCDLTEARDLFSLLLAIATTVKISAGADESMELTAELGYRIDSMGKTLLILDNMEQVAELAPATVARLLAAAPAAHFLVTSRENLRIGGESTIEVSPLPLAEAIELLQTRAMDRGWSLSESDAELFREIVERLDCLPLAIELAASRLPVLGAERLLDALGSRFELLRSRRRDLDTRQLTMLGSIDWSWDLLEDWERSALAQLSVFRGGFMLGEAEGVVDIEEWPEAPWLPEVIESLWEKSLLTNRQTPWGPRFGMLQTISDYGDEKLAADGASTREATQRRHLRHFAAEGASDPLAVAAESAQIGRIGLKVENLLAAATRAEAWGDHEAEANCRLAAMVGLLPKGPYAAMLRNGRRLRSLPGLSDRVRGQALYFEARAVRMLGRHDEAPPLLREALEAARASGDPHVQGRIASSLGFEARRMGRWDEARASYGRALEIAREQEYAPGEAAVLHELANLELELGHLEESRARYAEVEAIGRKFRLPQVLAASRDGQATLARAEGDHEEALRLYLEAHQMEVELSKERRVYLTLGNIGEMYMETGRLDEASEYLARAVEGLHKVGFYVAEATFLGAQGWVSAQRGEHELAQERLQRATDLMYEGTRAGVASERARLLCRRCAALLARDDAGGARDLFTEAESLLDSRGNQDPELRNMLASLRAQLQD